MASATGTKRWIEKCVTAGLLVVGASGCRSCTEDRSADAVPDARAAQPTMPTGMLMPAASAGAGTSAGPSATAGATPGAVARGMKGGAWVELQIARAGDEADRREFTHWNDDSWFVSLEAMTQLHEPFAKTLPGFDLFLPRLFAPDALVKLGEELAAFARSTSGDAAKTANDLASIVRSAAAKKQALWVLGPP
jgi:hypothetical protein